MNNIAVWMHYSRHFRLRRVIARWDSGRLVFLAAPEKFALLDITVSMDIHPNPGPDDEFVHRNASLANNQKTGDRQEAKGSRSLDLCELLRLRRFAGKPSTLVFDSLKSLGILRYRGPGKRRKCKRSDYPSSQSRATRSLASKNQAIEVVKRHRPAKHRRESPLMRNLIPIPREKQARPDNKAEFAVPKCMFINICSLSKTKNKVRAAVALEADLRNNDIDLCVVTETHLKPDQPDAVVNIADYNIYRRDRNWSGLDMRNKGGVAIYSRKNLFLIDVYRSRLYEVICITLCLPTGHRFLVGGIYHPPKHSYAEHDLMSILVDFTDNVLDAHPQTVIVLGGDFNQMDMDRLQQMSGWNAMVDFPKRGESHQDNCLTNRPDLFERCYPIHVSTKSALRGVILPAGTKLRPARRKVYIRDRRQHTKQDLYLALAEEGWREVFQAEDVDEAVNKLESSMHAHLDRCMPVRVVTMSSRDPAWMTPLVKVMLRQKTKDLRSDRREQKAIPSGCSRFKRLVDGC